jgi:putative tricarboxylic transport membrane protein
MWGKRMITKGRRATVMHRRIYTGSVLATVALFALLFAGCGTGGGQGGSGEEWPSGEIRWIIPSSPGGGFDTTSRQLQPYLEDELGVSLSVENQEGGNFAVGTTTVLNAGPDCNTIMTHGIPHLFFSYLTQDVDYTYEDFQPVSRLTQEPGVIRVRNDAPWETLENLIEDAKSRPGEIRASVSGLTSNNYLGLLDIQEATGAQFNIVPYDGGGPARTAVVSGEVDLTHAGVFNSLNIEDESRVLAVHQDENEWPDVTDNAPTVNEALGTSLPPNGSNYGLFVNMDCYEQNPERYERLVEAVQAATANEKYRQELEETGELAKLAVIDPEEYDQMNQQEADRLRELVEEQPELFE